MSKKGRRKRHKGGGTPPKRGRAPLCKIDARHTVVRIEEGIPYWGCVQCEVGFMVDEETGQGPERLPLAREPVLGKMEREGPYHGTV